jgi:hypothetical protein
MKEWSFSPEAVLLLIAAAQRRTRTNKIIIGHVGGYNEHYRFSGTRKAASAVTPWSGEASTTTPHSEFAGKSIL